MKIIPYYTAVTAIALFSACNNSAKNNDNDSDSSAYVDTTITTSKNAVELDTADKALFNRGAYSRLVEIEISKKIIQKTKSPTVKSLAQSIVKSQDSISSSFQALAAGKGYGLPTVLPEDRQIAVRKIDEYRNDGRDEYYVRMIMKEHQNTIDLFSMASRSKDKEVASFASQLLPMLKAQHKNALKVDSALLVPKANQGDDPLKLSDRKKNP